MSTPGPFAGLRAVDPGLSPRERASLDLIAECLTGTGADWLAVPTGLPKGLAKRHRRSWDLFTATPAPLLESWRVARHLELSTRPGDVLLLSDRDGAAGLFALEQTLVGRAERREVVVAAADSAVLEYSAVAGTIGGTSADAAHLMDWELVAYRFAALVAATSCNAVEILAGLGLEAKLAVRPEPAEPKDERRAPIERVWLPEAVSRLSRTATLLRGLSGALDARPDLDVVVSPDDRPDHVFSGTSWETVGGLRAIFGESLRRGDAPAADLVLLGDPFAVPAREVAAVRAGGTVVVVPELSCAAALWPDAPTWRRETDVAAVVARPLLSDGPRPTEELPTPRLEAAIDDPSRAKRISVGVPLFRDVRYLDACLTSILDQDDPPHEVLIIDDGSRSEAVADAVARWELDQPGTVRGLVMTPNQGVSAARNLALDAMTGDAFAFVDADDVLDPRFLAACGAALRADASLWAVATWTEFFGEYEGIEAKPPFDSRVGRRENPIVSTAVVVDMRVRDLGLRYSPDMAFLFCEDWEVWSRIIAAGGRMGLVPEPLARHRVHKSSGGFQRTELAAGIGKARATAPLDEVAAHPTG